MPFYTDVHTTKKYRLGTRRRATNGNEYIYLAGVASTVANDVVQFDGSTFATTRLVNSSTVAGPVAVAQAAVDSTSEWGWYLIYGAGTATAGTVSANANVQASGTAGSIDDTTTAGDYVVGMNTTAATSAGTAAVFCNYPFFQGGGSY